LAGERVQGASLWRFDALAILGASGMRHTAWGLRFFEPFVWCRLVAAATVPGYC